MKLWRHQVTGSPETSLVMRSLLSFMRFWDASAPVSASHSRPDAMRRRLVAIDARVLLIAGAMSAPVVLYALNQGTVLPFMLLVVALATGVSALAFHQRDQVAAAVDSHVAGMLAAGLLMTLAEPALVDFGIATAVLAPVYAALLGGTSARWMSWAGVAVVLVGSLLGALGVPTWPATPDPQFGLATAAVFMICVGIVAHAASRIDKLFQVYDRTQINAYKYLIDHVQDAVMRFSSAGELVFVSGATEKLLGCKRYELAGVTFSDRIHVLDRPAFLTAFAEASQDGQTRIVEIRLRRDEPSARVPLFVWAEVTLTPVTENTEPGERYEVVALCRDVSERKDFEAGLRAAWRAAEEASTAKSRFLATMGHELRTPLNAIVGFSEMMTSDIGGELSPTHREYAKLIHQGGTHLIEVIRMLLDMSRIEAGKFELQVESFAPASLVEPCLKMVEQVAAQRKVTIKTDLAPTLPNIMADERVCRQILINLLSNAVKFSHEGGAVRLTMRRQGQNLNISVADEGIGMSPDAVSRIGEAFFQANDGLSRRYEGTGLGLSIVKGLAELHEGSLHAISEANVGTTMTVLLPVNGPAIKSDETAAVTPLRRDEAPQQVPTWQEQKRKAL